ncbi:hypothetical protein [Spirosoma sp. KNUC1025]|uniref:hypothetical protein n=1 Tax=Spirosoma sp. KNUC1025 TaxID=2894082 RepID=UPI003865DA96|nr:hypothetical protein LN737_20240 [Spirosoma sp. KNUC1025]
MLHSLRLSATLCQRILGRLAHSRIGLVYLFLLILALSLNQSAVAQAPTLLWQKALGGSSDDFSSAMTKTADGGYILVGYTYSTDGDVTNVDNSQNFWVVKLNGSGQLVWQKTFARPYINFLFMYPNDWARAVTETPDGNIVVVGSTTSSTYIDYNNETINEDYWVIKLDGSGNLLWQKTLGGTSDDTPSSVTTTADGSIIIGGTTHSNDGDVSGTHGSAVLTSEYWSFWFGDYWIVKLDGSGNLLWQKTLGGTDEDQGNAITTTSDGGIVVVGYVSTGDGDITGFHGVNDAWVVKLSGTGQLLWQKALGGSDSDGADNITKTADGGYVVVGYAISTDGDVSGNHGDSDFWITKLSGTGQLLWQKAFGGSGNDRASAVTQTTNGDYAVTGFTQSSNGDVAGNHGSGDFWVIRLDGTGQLRWQKALGGSNADGGNAIAISEDGGIVVAGYTRSSDGDVSGYHGGYDYWAVKLSSTLSQTITLTNFTANPSTSCAGYPVQFTANVGNISAPYSYTLSNGKGNILTGMATTATFSQSLTVNGSGAQTFTLTITSSGASASAATPVQVNATNPDYQPLVDFYNDTHGSTWDNHTNWLSGCSPCGWYGVTCNPSGRVIALQLPNNHLNNQLSHSQLTSLAALTKLRVLNLSKNQLNGPIPPSIATLSELQLLYLNGNSFSGTLPASLSALSQLQLLDVSNNQLTGSIPNGYSMLSQLKALYLSKNQLTGAIPASFSQLSSLVLLYLNNNKFTGSIPASLASLTNLQQLFLNNNKLSGCLPNSLSALCGRTVDISGNTGLPGGGNFAAFCSNGSGSCGNAREGALEELVSLRAVIQGNPVVGSELVVDIWGAKGQPLLLQLRDGSGKLVGERQVEQAAEVERQRLSVSGISAGVLLLRVSSLNQAQTLKVFKSQ